jgi:RNA binding exosome subunit
MKLVNNINFRVFCNPDEDKEKIKSAFLSLIGYTTEQLSEEKIKYNETNAVGFGKKIIKIIEVRFEKERHCNKFIKRINEILSAEDKVLLIEQVNRLDDNMNFFMRLDKDALLDEGAEKDKKYVLTDSGNCFHISMNIEAHPQRKDVAHKVVKQIFSKEKQI